jgi:hypothetical protein
MAIKGLTPQLAERGKIKIGEKGEMKTSAQGKQFAQPKKLDHFIITTVQRDQAGRLLLDTALMDRIKADQGGVPKLVEIPVRLLYDDVDLNFLTRYSCYVGNRCWCTGDGEQAERYNEQSQKYDPVACPCERSDPLYPNRDKCKTLGTLQVLLEGVDRVGGVWKFRTTSWNTVNAILSSLALIKTITGGPLAGIPLHLVLSPKTVTVPTSGQSMVIYVVSLEYRGPEQKLAELGYEIAKRRIEHQIRMDRVEDEARRLLVAPHQEPAQEQEETAAEFFPETAASTEPQGRTLKATPVVTPTPEPQTTAETQSPDSREKVGQETLTPTITLPALMEAVKKSDWCITNLPVPLVTTKGVPIGQWLDYAPNLGGEMQVTLELADNLKDVTQGLTVEMVEKSFREAGIELVITTPAEIQEGEERLVQPEAVQVAQATQATQVSKRNGQGARKSLF